VDYLTAILLGALQGVAEFLPISSKGHLVIAGELLGVEEAQLELIIALHVGTLLSILVVYRRDLWPALTNPRLVAAVVAATLPLVVLALFLKDEVEELFDSPLVAGVGLCATAVLMALARRAERGETELLQIRLPQAVTVGLFQMLAVLPGISRSGSTIFGGLVSGLRREAAVNFSFYIAVPAIIGAAVLHMHDLIDAGPGALPLGPVLAGTLTSFVVGVASLKLLLRVVTQQKLYWFAWYCAIAGVGTIIWQVTK
jgi:undecaprenyl-diphosphatase